MLKEFKEFVLRGNMIDIAIGVIIAGAFAAVVASLTKNLINPVIGIFGKQNFSNLYLVLHPGDTNPGPYATLADAQKAGANTLNYGEFLSDIINFVILAAVVFIILKAVKKIMPDPKTEPKVEPVDSKETILLTEIRDLLKVRN